MVLLQKNTCNETALLLILSTLLSNGIQLVKGAEISGKNQSKNRMNLLVRLPRVAKRIRYNMNLLLS